ncbi:MAG: flagellar basal body protein, partial [Syntrophaceticus sp.]|nr:flagellar basal body protein [Syntrophaceticus sp.]
MIRGLYTAAAGMMAREAEVNVISNNMANVDTPGYRKD